MKVAAIVAFSGALSQTLMRPDNLETAFLNHDFSTDRNRRRTSATSVFTLADPISPAWPTPTTAWRHRRFPT